MDCIWRIILRDVLISVITAVIVELVLDRYRKPKAQIHFSQDERVRSKVKYIEESTS